MTKPEMIAAMAEKTQITKADTERTLAALVQVIQEELVAGNRVRIDGLGTFSPVTRAARKAHNPQDPSQKIDVPAKNAVNFKVGKELKRLVNE